jgi:tRNA(fMet)-specific endonuclease VapC
MAGANGLFISARARGLGLTLVTDNLDQFTRVPKLKTAHWAK